LPEIPGLALASRYDPIGDGSLVGGDFYDVFPVADGRWCVVLGDVCGQGVPAAALTSLVRYTVRAAARMWRSPAEVLRFTNDAILDHDIGERFCTLLVATVRPDGEGAVVTHAAGGHHLPLHRRAGGGTAPVGQVGTAVGLVRRPDVVDTTFRLGVGDLLVLTTDGVIEARDTEGVLVGDGFLEHLVDVHGEEGADALAGAIERAVLAVGGGRSGDDVAVVVVEAVGLADDEPQPVAAPGDGPFDERFPADTASVTEARRAVGAWLDAREIRGARVPDMLLALTELATNAVRSARTAVEVRAWLTEDAVMFEVTDDGPGFDPTVPRSTREIDPLAERGRGLFIVAALVDECTIESGPNGTIVRCYVAR
jgi:sigma-B regulation protein RsbU (phosphoserine phosphatase)